MQREVDSSHRNIVAKIITCILSWPVAVTTGWFIGDKRNIIAVKSRWDGPFSITDSPGFGLIVFTFLLWALGLIVLLGYPWKHFGFWVCMVASVTGGLFSFLLWFAFNAI